MEYDGMQLPRKFYSPVYETDTQRKNRMPDFRNTLSWVPDIQLNAHEQTNLSFYSSDVAGNYVVVFEGVTSDGKPVSNALTFEVK
jgi:methionine-rich copper-binding protein CopC